MSFRERWINAIYTVATGSKRGRTILAPLGAMVFFAIVAMFVWLPYLLDGWLGLPHEIPPCPAVNLVGVAVVLPSQRTG